MFGFRVENDRLVWEKKHHLLKLEPWGKDSIRVMATVLPDFADVPSALIDVPKVKPVIEIHEDSASITNGKINAVIGIDGRIQFLNNSDNSILLEEPASNFLFPDGRKFQPKGNDLHQIDVTFNANENERFYGLGQHRHGLLNQKGCVIDLLQRNCEVAIPFLISSRGYGFLWNNPGIGRVELAENHTRWTAYASRQIDYVVFAGDSYAEILERYVDATGHSPVIPEWATGFWQCKLRYRTQDELLAIAHEYKKRELPLSVIVIDFFHWPKMGDWRFDEKEWPDPAGMVKELDDMGVKVMVSVWPAVNRNSENFEEMKDRGLLLRTEYGIPVYFKWREKGETLREYNHYYDPTNPEARSYMWKKFRDNYYLHGIKIWWLDACEPETYPFDPENMRYHIGNGLEVGCLYPFMHQKAFFDGMKSEGEDEIFLLCRSAWAGSQRFGAAVWSGDITSKFETLRVQVRAGLNIGMSGIPWWTTDIGGFMDGDPEDPYFRELIVRWFQYGAFCPLFRLHGIRKPFKDGSGAANEVWSFGEKAYEIIKNYMFIRERLRPYIRDGMKLASEKGTPIMRPLFFDFPGDENCIDVEDQFMFGPDILVAPILFEKQVSREVYLPSGTVWKDVWTGKKFEGGKTITADAPLERIPLYTKGDSTPPIFD